MKLNKDMEYPALFNQAFSSPVINSQRILKAMAQFTASLVSANAKYDQVQRGENHFSSYEQTGYVVFRQKCASCL